MAIYQCIVWSCALHPNISSVWSVRNNSNWILLTFCFFPSNLFMSPIRRELGSGYLIKYVRTSIMECIVEFAYTSNCDVNQENLTELLTTAEYFCLLPLIDRCSEFILSILSLKNCVSLMCMTRFLSIVRELRRANIPSSL